MSTEKGPAGSFLRFSIVVLVACVLLWLAVSLLQQVWGWLVVMVLIIAAVWLTVQILRWRRDRWFR